MVHFFDVVVMKVSNTVHKTKQATRNTLARNRMLARLTKAAEQGVVLVTHDNAELMWLRRHVGADDIAEPEPYLFCFQHDWGVLTPAERALRTIKGLAEFHPDWAFCCYDAALLWGLEVPNDLIGPRFLVKTGCSTALSGGCRLLRPQAAGALEQVDGVRWRTVCCTHRFRMVLRLLILRCGRRAYRVRICASASVPIARAGEGIAELR